MFRFTIRDVLWLTAVVALAVGWWLDRRRLATLAETNELRLQWAELEVRAAEGQAFKRNRVRPPGEEWIRLPD